MSKNGWITVTDSSDLCQWRHTSGLCLYHAPSAEEASVTEAVICIRAPAMDDDGLPHALEHLVFFGSEAHPRGYLDAFASRMMCSDVNAYTKNDHTCFTVSGLANQGIQQVIPKILDHVLHPVLPEDAFQSEIYHVNMHGEAGGVMYCELREREFDTDLASHYMAKRLLYTDRGFYNCEAAGLAACIRNESLTRDRVIAYHGQHYVPSNMCVGVAGPLRDLNSLLGDIGESLTGWSPPPRESFDRGPNRKTEIKIKGTLQRHLIKEDKTEAIVLPTADKNEDGKKTTVVAWEVRLPKEVAISSSILLEFLRKCNTNPFRGFQFHLQQLDESFAQVILTLEDRHATAKGLKESLLDFKAHMDPQDLLECVRQAVNVVKLQTLYDQELHFHAHAIKEILCHFLYSSCRRPPMLNTDLEPLLKEGFQFWASSLQEWVAAPWAVIHAEYSKKMHKKLIKKRQRSLPRVEQLPRSHYYRLENVAALMDVSFEHNNVQYTDIKQNGKVKGFLSTSLKHFSIIYITFSLAPFTKDELTYVPLICELIKTKKKSAVKLSCVAVQNRDIVILSLIAPNAGVIPALRYLWSFPDDLDGHQMANVSHQMLDLSDVLDPNPNQWRIFLTFKHYLKMLKSVAAEDANSVKAVQEMVKTLWATAFQAHVITDESNLVEACSILERLLHFKSMPDQAKDPSYGHHRINVSHGLEAGHATIMMGIPRDSTILDIAGTATVVAYLNRGHGPLWKHIRGQGLAYACTMTMDLVAREILVQLDDCLDVVQGLVAIRQVIKKVRSEEDDLATIETAKRSAVYKLSNKSYEQVHYNVLLEDLALIPSQK